MISSSNKPNRSVLAWARAPGKVILSGEQFVVLGAPAVSMAINLYSKVQVRPNLRDGIDIAIDIPLRFLPGQKTSSRVEDRDGFIQPLQIAARTALNYADRGSPGIDMAVYCGIPIGAGLGSSAATTVAIISAVSKLQGVTLSRKEIFKLAFVPERFLHGEPSGVDQATCIYGGSIEYTRPSKAKPIPVKTNPLLVLCDSGVHHKTKTLVGQVVEKSKAKRSLFREYLAQVRQISVGVVRALKAGDSEDLGTLMSENHELLRKIGVSHPKLDHLVAVAKRSGALGAKLTGAGGGGCIVAVCSSPQARSRIARNLRREGGAVYDVSRDVRGVEAGTHR